MTLSESTSIGYRDRSDAELITASGDDPKAFREFYDRWAEQLLAYFYRRVFDPEVAADLLAETFAVAFQRRRRFRDVGKPGGSWLYGIAARELSQWRRRRRVELRAVRRLGIEVPALDDQSIARIEELVDGAAQRAAVRAALERMTESERVAVELRVVEELDYPEIARRLDCSEGAARTRVYRGLARLTSQMEAGA